MGLTGFKKTFTWNGKTSQSRCCTTFVWYVDSLLNICINLRMWKPLLVFSAVPNLWVKMVYDIIQLLQRVKLLFFFFSSVTLWQKWLVWNNTDLRTRRVCWWKYRPARRVTPQHLFSCKQTLHMYHSGEGSSFVVDPSLNSEHGGCVARSSQPPTTRDTPRRSLSRLPLPKAAWKS